MERHTPRRKTGLQPLPEDSNPPKDYCPDCGERECDCEKPPEYVLSASGYCLNPKYLVSEFLEFAKLIRSHAQAYFLVDEGYDEQIDTIDPIIDKCNEKIEKWEERKNE